MDYRAGLLACALFLLGGCGSSAVQHEADAATDSNVSRPWGEDNDDSGSLEDGEADDPDVISPPEEPWGDEDGGVDANSTDSGPTDAGSTDAATRPDAATCVRRTYRLTHLQASMEHFDPPAELTRSIDVAFAAGAHTISWTEIEAATQVRHIAARTGWATFWPSGRAEVVARNAVPVSWRTDTFRLVRGQSWLASEGMAGVSPSRWVTRVWLTHLASGRVISRVAHHSVSGVDGAGREPVEWRRRMHALDIAKFRDVMLLDTIPVIGSADFNTTRLRSLLGSAFAYDVPATGGSHGSRLIDWIVRRPHADHRFVSVGFVGLGPSDHRGVRANYDYRPPCAP